jgi:hypothetical protein
MPRDIGPEECTNKTIVAMEKHMLEAQKIPLGGNGGKCGLYPKLMFDNGIALCYTKKT